MSQGHTFSIARKLGFHISLDTSRFLVATIWLFAANSLLQFARLSELLPSITEFVEFPLALAQMLLLLMWIALGTHHLLLRLSCSLLAITCLFFLCCFDWLPLYGVPWNQFEWLGFFAGSTAPLLTFGLPITLLAVTLPLSVGRLCQSHSDDNAVDKLTIRHLLGATACVGMVMGLILAISPYPSWLAGYARESTNLVSQPTSFVVVALLPGLSNTAIAYLALVFWHRCRHSWHAMAGLTVASSFTIAASYIYVARFAWDQLIFDWGNVVYLAGQTSLTLFLVFVVLGSVERSLVRSTDHAP